MKSLEKDRTRRYASATEFAADIQRHINNEPVLAVAPSLSYKIGKFVRRNRSLVTAAAAIFIVLIAGIISSTIFAVWALHERDVAKQAQQAEFQQRQIADQRRIEAENAKKIAQEQRQIAEQERETAKNALAFMLKRHTFDSLAVMPFTCSGGEELDYLSVGIPDMIQQSLSYLQGLRVSPFESVWSRYGEVTPDPCLVGIDYNVMAIVTGTIEAQGENLSIKVNILETEEGIQILNLKFPEKLANLIQIPTEIAQKIANDLQIQFTDQEAQRAFKVATNNPEAFMNYMKGRSYFRMRTAEGHRMAIKFFEKATNIDPSFAKAFSGLADIYMTQFQYVGAPLDVSFILGRKAAEEALALDNDLAEAHASMGLVLASEGKLQQAIYEFERAIELNPNYVQAYQWLGKYSKAGNNLKKAIETMEKGRVYDPVNFAIKSNLGEYYIQSGQTEKGTELILSSVELSMGSAAFSTSGGLLISQYGEHELAIKLAKEGLELDPNTHHTITNAMNIYQHAGQYETAIDLAKKNIELYPDALNVFNYLATALRSSEVNPAAGNKKVMEEFERLIKKYPQSPAVYNQLMTSYRNAGQVNKAIAAFESLAEQYPQSPTPFRFLGEAYRIAGEFDKAIEQHKKSIQLKPKNSILHYSLGLTYNAAGKYVEAEEHFKEAIRYHTVRTPLGNIINNVRDLYLKRGENQKAVELYIDAINNDPDMNAIYYQLGRLYRDIYEYENAFKHFKDVINRFPDYVTIQHEYAKTLSYIGKHQEAIELYHKVLECIPYTVNANNSMGYRYLQAGDYENAIEYFKKAVKTSEDLSFDEIAPNWHLSDAYLANEQYTEAADSYRKTFNLRQIPNAEDIFDEAFATEEYNQTTLQNYLKNILEAADNTNMPFTPREKAKIYAYKGEKELALKMLDIAFEAKDTALAGDVWLFWYDELKTDSRFQELIRKLKLDKYF